MEQYTNVLGCHVVMLHSDFVWNFAKTIVNQGFRNVF